MATGQRPFGARSGVALTDAILHQSPPRPRSANTGLSPGLEAVILKALDKDPDLRHQSAKDLFVDLERLQTAAASGASEPVTVVRPGRRGWPWLVAAATVITISAAAWLLRPLPPPRITNMRRLHLDLGSFSNQGLLSTWATDGLRIYYGARKEDGFHLLQVPIAGGEPSEIEMPSPLRRGLEIYAFLPRQSALLCLGLPDTGSGFAPWPAWVVPVPKGPPHRLVNLSANNLGATCDGEWIALAQHADRRILVARSDGSELRALVQMPSPPSRPTWASDGRRIRFTARGGPPGHGQLPNQLSGPPTPPKGPCPPIGRPAADQLPVVLPRPHRTRADGRSRAGALSGSSRSSSGRCSPCRGSRRRSGRPERR
jgi:hypothetical protein